MKGVTMVASEIPGLAQEFGLILEHGEIYVLNRTKGGTPLRISEKAAILFSIQRQKAEVAFAQLVLLQELAKVGFWSEPVWRIHGKNAEGHQPNDKEGV